MGKLTGEWLVLPSVQHDLYTHLHTNNGPQQMASWPCFFLQQFPRRSQDQMQNMYNSFPFRMRSECFWQKKRFLFFPMVFHRFPSKSISSLQFLTFAICFADIFPRNCPISSTVDPCFPMFSHVFPPFPSLSTGRRLRRARTAPWSQRFHPCRRARRRPPATLDEQRAHKSGLVDLETNEEPALGY